jgi:hypothetical protein
MLWLFVFIPALVGLLLRLLLGSPDRTPRIPTVKKNKPFRTYQSASVEIMDMALGVHGTKHGNSIDAIKLRAAP